MIRSTMFTLSTAVAAFLAFAAPQKAEAQYRGYPTPGQYSPYQRPYEPEQPGPSFEDLRGTWFMGGQEDLPCEIIPSRRGDRALFINEKGDRAEGYLRGNRIVVPRWQKGARIDGDEIRWDNRVIWTR